MTERDHGVWHTSHSSAVPWIYEPDPEHPPRIDVVVDESVESKLIEQWLRERGLPHSTLFDDGVIEPWIGPRAPTVVERPRGRPRRSYIGVFAIKNFFLSKFSPPTTNGNGHRPNAVAAPPKLAE